MGKVYRTAQGRELDIEKIKLQHEMVPALGNMRVNARGDQLGPGGRILKTREEIMDDHYATKREISTNSPKEGPILTRSPRPSDQPIPTSSKRVTEFVPGDAEIDSANQTNTQSKAADEPKGGLARAIKRAQEGSEKKGIRRI